MASLHLHHHQAQHLQHLQHPQHRLLAGSRSRHRAVCCWASFEPHVDSQALTAQLVVLSATAATAAYWWLSVVPSARRTLAKEKRAGPLNEYLVGLQRHPKGKAAERWFYSDWLGQLQRRQDMARAAAAKRAAAAASQSASPTATQQQQEEVTVPGSLQEPEAAAADEDRQPSFWSLDNPILATTAMLAAVALVSSLLHQ